jgi:hypothetical protein
MDRRRADGVVEINKRVGGKIRIEGDPEQSALAICTGWYGDKRSGQEDTVLDDAELAPLEANEEPAIRRKIHRRRAASQVGSEL